MTILFVRSCNRGIDAISTNQGQSLTNKGQDILYFDIIGKGMKGYLKNIILLRKFIKVHKPDIIHAHYSLSGIISLLTLSGISVGVSLMGSDLNNASFVTKNLLRILSSFFWDFTIVKSIAMKRKLKVSKCMVIQIGRASCRERV